MGSARGATGRKPANLPVRHIRSSQSSRSRVLGTKLLAIGLVLAICLSAGAATTYMVVKSLFRRSDQAVASNQAVAESTNSQSADPGMPPAAHPTSVPSASQPPENTGASPVPPGNTGAASTVNGNGSSQPELPRPDGQSAVPKIAAPSPVTFEPLLLDEPATSFTMSEDGRFVIISHQAAGTVSIFDVLADKVSHVISTSSPRALLSRGDQLFVGNYGEGKISVYSATSAWALVNELQITKPNIVFISAAHGENFGGEIIVTCHGPGRQASYQDSQIYRVDVKRDRCELISNSPVASVSFDGKNVLTQSSFNLSPSGSISVFSYDEFVSGNAKPIFSGGVQQTPFVYQCYQGSYWISENMIFGGAPIAMVHQNPGKIVIPDAAQKVVYLMDEDLLSARRLNSNLTEMDDHPRKIQLPKDQMKTPSRLFHQQERCRNYLLDHPVAVTHGSDLSLFLMDQTDGSIVRARTAAFADAAQTEFPAPTPATPNPEPARSPASEAVEILQGWPQLIAAGSKFEHQFPVDRGMLKIQLVDGPPGMQVNAEGLLTWMPTNAHAGLHELKLRVEQPSGPFFERPKIEVVNEELAKSVGGDLTKVNQFDSFELDTDHYAISKGHDPNTWLLLQGKTLRIVGEDGIKIVREIQLPQRYHDIEERSASYIAVSSQPPFLDVIDRKSLRIRQHVDLVFPEFKVLNVSDLCIHPDSGTSYVCVQNGIELPRYTVLIVNETSGSVEAPGIVGTWAEVSPDGQTLYTGYSDIYEKGVRFHINPGWRLIETPEYGSVDMLLGWNIVGKKPSLEQIVRKAGGNGSGIRLSPDGNRIIYLSHVGTPAHSSNLIGFAASDFESREVHYATKGRASTKDAAFHPNLPWVAMPGDGSVTIFSRETAEVLEHRLLATLGGLGSDVIERMIFSPDGRSIVLLRSGGESGRYLQRIPLIISDSENSIVNRSPDRLPVQKLEPKPVAATELNSLNAATSDVNMSPLEIGRDYTGSVVVVRTTASAGTGFIVGDNGYVLTCAHVVTKGSDLTVMYNEPESPDRFSSEAAEVIRIDHDRDIALLKFNPKRQVKSVRLCKDNQMESGEPVTVIGNPGAGDSILSHTMTNGIVSNPRRELDGQIYIQISAAVNPGNSGGPLFDQHGNVAGLVALKADIEGAAFAVPSESLRMFLNN
ncbi:MAG: trypsin-like peptidase domain-containing protein [Planctomyces sp.]|nr:trypsin-like peptidase domain-containing protein [Planctomyces sp.]